MSNGPAKTGARRLLKAPAWALGIAAMVVVVAVGVFVLRTMGIDAGLEPGTASSLIAGFCLVAAAYLGYELRREGEGLVAFALLLCSLISALYGSALQIPILEQAFHPIDRATFGVAQLRSSPVLFQDLSVGQCAADWGAWGDDVVAWVVPCDRPHYMQYFGRPDDDGQCEHDLLSHAVEAAMQEWRIDVFVLEGPPAACFLMPADESGQEADLSRYTEENLIK